MLCTLDVQGAGARLVLDQFLAEQDAPELVRNRARDLAWATFEKLPVWDEQIAAVSQRWDLKRMGLVDRNILRLALQEISQPEVTPVKVAMDEAIELAKEFGTEESPAFVNGVLDAVWKKSEAREPAKSDQRTDGATE
jgi:transcription antitermination protein NusB